MNSSISFQNKNFATREDPETVKKTKFDNGKISSKPLEVNSIATNIDKYKHKIVKFTNIDPSQQFLDLQAQSMVNKMENFQNLKVQIES
jgi:hypothetical protein